MILQTNYLVEELSSVCHEGANIEVLEGVMYAIKDSDGSTFLNSIEAYTQICPSTDGVWSFIANIFLDIYLVNVIIIIVL